MPRFDGSVYRGDGFAFKVAKVPVGWQRLDDDRSALSFSDLANRGAVLINGRCGRDEDVPLKALTQHLFIAFTERNIETEELVPFDQREALHTTLSAKLDGVPLRYDVWVLKRNGCVFDLLYFAPPERFQAGVPGFAEFVRGFTSRVADGP
ncbi:MAG: hypothetical protein EXR75_16655 [Myxococcales bacterium]|nr:hypothetical protein [Myxococcales bacterium]